MTRCRVGDLCEIIRSTCGNEGRRVVVLEPQPMSSDCTLGPCWRVQPLQPLTAAHVVVIYGQPVVFPVGQSMDVCVFPDSWLRPIRDAEPDAAVERAVMAPKPQKEFT